MNASSWDAFVRVIDRPGCREDVSRADVGLYPSEIRALID